MSGSSSTPSVQDQACLPLTPSVPAPTAHVVDKRVLEPFEYIQGVPGKDVRGALIDSFQEWLKIPPENISAIKSIVASLHNASLLVDDIEDNSKLRRGVPVAHSIYGVATTINTANYVYFLALEKCQKLQNAAAMNIFIAEMLNLHRGQGQDILWRDSFKCPTEEQYRNMVKDKTGGLFRLAVGIMQVFSENKTDYYPLLDLLGYYFQIRDDYLNVSSVAYMQTKSFCEDLTEGKFSFPIIHTIQENMKVNDFRLMNILRQRTEDINLKTYAVKWMEKCGSLEFTRSVLSQLCKDILIEIDRLGGHPTLVGLIKELESQIEAKARVRSDSTGGVYDASNSSNSNSSNNHSSSSSSSNSSNSSSNDRNVVNIDGLQPNKQGMVTSSIATFGGGSGTNDSIFSSNLLQRMEINSGSSGSGSLNSSSGVNSYNNNDNSGINKINLRLDSTNGGGGVLGCSATNDDNNIISTL